MEIEKIRSMSDTELGQAQRDEMDQLFRLKFQMKMGQTESLKKIQGLRRGVARLKTVARERALGINEHIASAGSKSGAKSEAKGEAKSAPVKAAAKKSKAKSKAKPAKKKAAAASNKKKSGKKSGKR
jgi:large subunit ribosomal protein L29